jgi:hypothetical protein
MDLNSSQYSDETGIVCTIRGFVLFIVFIFVVCPILGHLRKSLAHAMPLPAMVDSKGFASRWREA